MKPGQRIGLASIVKKEENNSNSKPKREKSFSELVRECCYKKFLLDTEEANLMKCALLGLEDVLIPTQEQVDQSRLFEERPSDRNVTIEDISEYWLPILNERFMLTEKALSDMTPKEGHTLLYTYESLLNLHPSAARAWAEGTLKPAFVAVVLTLTPLPLQKEISLEHFHTANALQKETIPKREELKKTNMQYAYCSYCGIRIENLETCVNHVRQHLHLHLLCGGCYAFHLDTFKPMSTHMHRCLVVKDVKALQAEKDKEEAKGSQTGDGEVLKEAQQIAPTLGTLPAKAHLWLLSFKQHYPLGSPQGVPLVLITLEEAVPPPHQQWSRGLSGRSIPPSRSLFTPE